MILSNNNPLFCTLICTAEFLGSRRREKKEEENHFNFVIAHISAYKLKSNSKAATRGVLLKTVF